MTASLWLLAAATLGLSLLLNNRLIKAALYRKIFLPAIRPRDAHTKPTPRVGGIALLASFIFITLAVAVAQPSLLHFTDSRLWGLDRNLVGLLLALLLLGAVNIVDDYRGLNWPIKLIGQISAAVVVVAFGITVSNLSNPFGGPIVLGQWAALFVVIWLVVISNVVNWLDGVDGVAGGVSAITLAVLSFLSVSQFVSQDANGLVAMIGFGATLGFLYYNLRGEVFLGDTGSMTLGFLIGVLAIISGGKVATVFLVLAIPFIDAVAVFFARVIGGRSPFLPDRRHLIHRLLDRGYSKRKVMLSFYASSLIFGLIALNTQTLGKFWALLAAVVIMVLSILLISRSRPMMGSDE